MQLKLARIFFLAGALGFSCGCAQPLVNLSVLPASVTVGASQSVQFTVSADPSESEVSWSVNGVAGGNTAIGTIDTLGNFTAPPITQNAVATITATNMLDTGQSANASVTIIAPGVVAPTANPQVALYTILAPPGANVSVEFSTDTSYSQKTWQQPAPAGGGPVSIFVAGMRSDTLYHMRAVFQSTSGVFFDSDHPFTTGSPPVNSLPVLNATTSARATPQSGVELLDLIPPSTTAQAGVALTDLDGNILWLYSPNVPGVIANPVKMLPNGNFLINFSSLVSTGVNSVLQEVDLAGDVVWQMTAAQLNAALAAATCAGCNVTVVGTHHDFAILPNGHLIVIADVQKMESGLAGQPDPVAVTGDVLIDLDQNHNPVWVWSSFDHLDLNRAPFSLPDWTHTNSVVYSPDDKDLIISMRNQDWVLKIDYNDAKGTGNVLWRLGYQGDFTLQGGVSPADWFYAQHDANIASSNSSGVFELLLFDDGDQRVLDSSGTVCGATPCVSRVPLFQLDETAKTAKIEWVDAVAPAYSFFGGSARVLANGNIEFDECALTTSAYSAAIYEVTDTPTPQTVWQMQITGQYAYRGIRIPSFYPGVQW